MTQSLRLGLAGLGTVGRGVVRILTDNRDLLRYRCPRDIEIVAVSARDRSKDRGIDISPYQWFDDPVDMAKDPTVDAVVELIGGTEGPARTLVDTAIANGKDVVTANKALLAIHGDELALAAESADVSLRYEAAVAGGIPIVKGLREGLSANKVERITGILNGTCNYILSEMEMTGRPFSDVLRDAQRHGYAEADPTFDIGGIDAAHKLAILARLAYGTGVPFDQVHVEGIERIEAEDITFAKEFGYRIKLLGLTRYAGGSIEARVHPCLVRLGTPIAEVQGVMNAIMVEAEPVTRNFFEGPGAGEGPTASAVVADIVDLARGLRLPVFMGGVDTRANRPILPIEEHVGPFYVRLELIDRPGVMATITGILAENEISIESIIQRGRRPNEPVPIVMITHEASDRVMRAALDSMAALDTVVSTPRMIRIEDV